MFVNWPINAYYHWLIINLLIIDIWLSITIISNQLLVFYIWLFSCICNSLKCAYLLSLCNFTATWWSLFLMNHFKFKILIIDGWLSISNRSLCIDYLQLLDDNRELFIAETQEMVSAHPRFMLFATQNPPGQYGGRKVSACTPWGQIS